jgi:hypothetical protein
LKHFSNRLRLPTSQPWEKMRRGNAPNGPEIVFPFPQQQFVEWLNVFTKDALYDSGIGWG